jgi:tetratricopeptide (TPR) repeat protein
LTLIPGLPDIDRRRETELDLQIALGRALEVSRSWSVPELDEVHSRARELALMLNRPRALLFALWGQWYDIIFARADLKRAQRLGKEIRELGEATGDVLMQVLGCEAEGFTRYWRGEFTAGQANFDKGLGLYDPAQRVSYSEFLSHDVRVMLRANSSWLLACLGYLDQALSQRDPALDEARGLSHPPTLAFAVSAAWFTGWFVGLKPALLLQNADEELALATEYGLGFYRATAVIRRGWCLAALGRAEEGIPLFIGGVAGLDELGFILWRPWHLMLLADAGRVAGQWQAALDHLAEARHLAEETEQRCFLVETLRMTAEILARGDRSGAETRYHEAIAIAQQQSAKLWELRAAMSLARLWRDQGKLTAAHELLVPVYGWFTEGLGTPVLQEAKALLEELAA